MANCATFHLSWFHDHIGVFFTGNGAIHGIVEVVLLNKQYSVACFILTIKNDPKPYALKTEQAISL